MATVISPTELYARDFFAWPQTTTALIRAGTLEVSLAVVTVNGRTYQVPQDPTVIICIDGGDPAYFQNGFDRGLLPALQHFREHGVFTTAKAVVPTFTNPNNLSIVTGVPPARHGISGNFFLDPESGTEVIRQRPEHPRQ
jgi:phosphonoacetate hydrolase